MRAARFGAGAAGWSMMLALVAASPADLGVATAAGKTCATRLQSYFASDFKDAAYQQKAFQKVASAWKRPSASPAAGAKAVVIATIAADGTIAPPVLHMKSGSDAWDAAALAAVKSAAPFDPLPKSYPHPLVEVHFHFECAG
jgi:protein TonB